MKKMRLLLIMLLMGVWMGVARADFLKPVTARASSEYSSGYVIANLFDGTPALGSSANLGGQWACSGAAELTPIVGMDFGGTTNFQFTGIGYSQRSAVDAVVTIKLWFSTCPMGWSLGSPPSPPPDETLSLTNTSNTVFSQYNFTTSHSGRYVVAQFIGTQNNPGGYEMRLIGTGTAITAQYFSGTNGASWNNTDPVWGGASGGPYGMIWGAGNLAVFEGSATNVAVGDNINVAGISFSNTSYSLDVGGAWQLSGGNYGGDIANFGTLSYSSSANQTFGGIISGLGMLLKSGVGTLTLSGNNTYTGGSIVNNGTLRLDLASNGGNYVNVRNHTLASGATLQFYNINTGVDNLLLSAFNPGGTGAIVKTGPGYLNIAFGNTISNFDGALVVKAGTLGVNSGAQGSGRESLTVMSGASFDIRTGSLAVDALSDGGGMGGTLGSTWTAVTLTLGNNNGGGTFSGVIQNTLPGYGNAPTVAVTKNGAGLQLLTGTNTYSAATTVNSGVLEIGGVGQLGGGNYTGAIANSGTLVYSSSAPQTFGGTISGAGVIHHLGTGTLTLTGTVSCNITNNAPLIFSLSSNGSYSGFLSGTGTVSKVGAGTLILPSAGLHSSSGTLSVSGGAVGFGAGARWSAPVTVSSGCSLVGAGFYSGPVVVGDGASLKPGTASGGGTESFADLTLGNGTNVFSLYAPGSTASNGMVTVTNSWNVNNAVIAINPLQIPLPNGDYPVFVYTNAWSGSGFNTNVLGNISRCVWTLTNYNNGVYLHVAGNVASLKWDPDVSGAWDVMASSNWLDGAAKAQFYSYDGVTFDDAGAAKNSTVSLVTNVLASQITVSNTVPYVFTGTGTVSCLTSLQKVGAGTLTLRDAPNIACPITLGGGVVCFDAAAVNPTYSQVLSGAGGSVLKTGAGTVTLAGTNTYFGVTTVGAGKLVFQQQVTLGANSTIATLSGGVTEWRQTGNMSYLTASPVMFTGEGRINKTGAFVLYGDQASGKFKVNQSAGAVFDLQGGSIQQGGGYGGNLFLGSNQGGLNVASGALFELFGANATVDALTGAGTIDNGWGGTTLLSVGAANNTSSANNPFFSGNTATFSGVLQNGAGTFALIKTGTGVQVLTGTNTYTGGTTVSNGTLRVNNAAGSGTGSGAVTVAGGTLGGTGTVSGVISVQSGGTLAPGAMTNSVGTFRALTNVTLQAGASLEVQLSANGVCDLLACSSTSTVAGATLSASLLADDIKIGTKYVIVSAPYIAGAFANAPVNGQIHTASRNFTVTYPGRTNVVLEAVNSGSILMIQ